MSGFNRYIKGVTAVCDSVHCHSVDLSGKYLVSFTGLSQPVFSVQGRVTVNREKSCSVYVWLFFCVLGVCVTDEAGNAGVEKQFPRSVSWLSSVKESTTDNSP